MNILSLPDLLLGKVMSYISYDEISRLRLVCKKFDGCAQKALNQGFIKAEIFHAKCGQKVKDQLPRRESERRKHALSEHCDILTAVKTRLSLLRMTYVKFIDLKQCCFIPGKVLDELFKVLRLASDTEALSSHDILQELRDLSSMAMEHFDETIAPALRRIVIEGPKSEIMSSGDLLGAISEGSGAARGKTLSSLRRSYKQLHCKYKHFKKERQVFKQKMLNCDKKLNSVLRKVLTNTLQISEQATHINGNNDKINSFLMNFQEHSKSLLNVKANVNNASTNDATCKCQVLCPCAVKTDAELANKEKEQGSSSDESSAKKRLKID